MKKIHFLLLLVLLLQACKENNIASIKGNIKDFGDGEIYLIEASESTKMDTIQVKNGSFSHQVKLSEPNVYLLNFGPDQKIAFLILEKGNTSVEYQMGKANSLKIVGGKEQKYYDNFITECRPYFDNMDSLSKLANANIDNQEILEKLRFDFVTLDSIVKTKQFDFVKKNPSSIVSAFLAANYLSQEPEKTLAHAEELYSALDKKIQDTYYGKKIAEIKQQLQNNALGSAAPNFTLNNLEGKPVSLSDYKGKITLIDFWASWCGPCRRENPNVVATYKKYHPKGFEILGVSLDDNKNKWQDAITKDGLIWTQVSDLKGWESEVAQLYGVQYIPNNFLIDQNGKIIGKDLVGSKLEQALSEIFK